MKTSTKANAFISFSDDTMMVAEPDDQFTGEEWKSPSSDDLCIWGTSSTEGGHSSEIAIVRQLASKGIVYLGVVDGMSAAGGMVIGKRGEAMRSTDRKIDSTCDEVGYEYRSTFANSFTKLVGMRPSSYRAAARNKVRDE